MATHKVGVAKHKRIKGIINPNEAGGVPQLELMTLREALETKWETDAHFVAYNTEGSRYRKAMASRGTVKTNILVFDCDNPDHERWHSTDEVIRWFDIVVEIVPHFFCVYTTRSGGRIILKLPKALDVRQAEIAHKNLVQDFIAKGLNVDAQCSDWTRLFRLPYVVRDGAPTWENPYTDMVFQDRLFKLEFTPDMPEVEEFISKVKTFDLPQPGPEARDLVWVME